MKPRLYLETTIPSYLTARPSRDLVIAGHQQITQEWWEQRRHAFRIYVSEFVVEEAAAGDRAASHLRMKVIRDLPLLDVTSEVGVVASEILESGVLTQSAATDAAHIAIAAVHGMDFLMTWNCTHLANAFIAKEVTRICTQLGLECPIICTPEELLGG